MKKVYQVAIATLLLGATVAAAQPFPSGVADNVYVGMSGGITSAPSLRVGSGKLGVYQGYNAGGRIGYKLDDILPMSGFAVEADVFNTVFNYRNTSSLASLNSLSFMGNIIYHTHFDFPVGLYAGAGAGGVRDLYSSPTAVGNRTVFGWQGIAGADYPVAPNLSVFAEYRYQNAHNSNIASMQIGNMSHNASVGFRLSL